MSLRVEVVARITMPDGQTVLVEAGQTRLVPSTKLMGSGASEGEQFNPRVQSSTCPIASPFTAPRSFSISAPAAPISPAIARNE